jgi:hypothetical protein
MTFLEIEQIIRSHLRESVALISLCIGPFNPIGTVVLTEVIGDQCLSEDFSISFDFPAITQPLLE